MTGGKEHDDRGAIRALIFDMDGLLVDSEPIAEIAIGQFLRLHGRELHSGTMELMLGRRLPDAVVAVAGAYGLSLPIADLIQSYDELRLAALRGNLQPMPGAAALLTFARAAGLKLALATSSLRTHADLSLAETGLVGLFDAEATGEEVERGKPEPDIFLLAADRLGQPPGSCVVLEDAPAGLASAAAAGMRRLWIPNVNTRGLPVGVAIDAQLPDLGAVIPWLQEHGVDAPSLGTAGDERAAARTGERV
jgi:HAD superfamily hydrolase (TIGR01509 family)